MPDAPPTLADRLADAIRAYDDLAALGEEIEDEWSYVGDLREAWVARLEAIAGEHGAGSVPPPLDAALEAAIDEIARITDPHRAIDWLSTFPQVLLVALDERP